MEKILMLQTQPVEPNQIPLSKLNKRSFEIAEQDEELDILDGPDLLVTLGVLQEFGISYRRYYFSNPDTSRSILESEVPILPDEVHLSTPVGVIVAMEGELYVVVEVSEESMCLTPVRYIDITK